MLPLTAPLPLHSIFIIPEKCANPGPTKQPATAAVTTALTTAGHNIASGPLITTPLVRTRTPRVRMSIATACVRSAVREIGRRRPPGAERCAAAGGEREGTE